MPPVVTAAGIDAKVHAITPAAMRVTGGMVTVDVTGMQVTEPVTSAPRLTARLVVRNGSATHTIRLVNAKIEYVDGQGRPIEREGARTTPALTFSRDKRLDPGQETAESLDVDFPAEALTARRLAQIRLEIAFIPSPYREETLIFAVRVGDTT